MGKNINIDSEQWCDVVFADRNKAYGAYRLRATSGKRHLVAFFIVILLVIGLMLLPYAVDFVEGLAPREQVGPMEESFELAQLENLPKEEKVPEENILKQVSEPPPPPELKQTIKHTIPDIVDDEDVKDEDMMKAQDELLELKGAISIADVEGSDSPDAVDISDLNKHQVIVQAPVEEKKIFDIVEQMPGYPGGEAERLKFLKDNIVYPSMARENGIQGTVTVGFVVTASGKLEDIKIVRGRDRLLDEEALRVTRLMPNWIPGKQGGKNVSVKYVMRIAFKLN